MASSKIFVSGASGQLGNLVVKGLVSKIGAANVVAGVRDPSKAKDLAELGVELRQADFTSSPAALTAAFAGIDKFLLVSTNSLGPGKSRSAEHNNAIDAAKAAGVKLIVYTSLLKADSTPALLAKDHVETEAKLKTAGVPFVVLRNGWYIENYNGNIAPALQYGGVYAASGKGRISGAARADYADAAVAVLTAAPQDQGEYVGKVFELAGDESFNLDDWAAALTELSGKPVAFSNQSEADFAALLVKFGLPEPVAKVLADADTAAVAGALEDNSKTLSKLIGRPTTPLKTVLAAALKQ